MKRRASSLVAGAVGAFALGAAADRWTTSSAGPAAGRTRAPPQCVAGCFGAAEHAARLTARTSAAGMPSAPGRYGQNVGLVASALQTRSRRLHV